MMPLGEAPLHSGDLQKQSRPSPGLDSDMHTRVTGMLRLRLAEHVRTVCSCRPVKTQGSGVRCHLAFGLRQNHRHTDIQSDRAIKVLQPARSDTRSSLRASIGPNVLRKKKSLTFKNRFHSQLALLLCESRTLTAR